MSSVRSGCPTSNQYRRASLAAVSTASPPPEPRNTREGIGARSASISASSRAGALTKSPNAEYASSRAIWAGSPPRRSPAVRGPTLAYQRLAVASRYRRPSVVPDPDILAPVDHQLLVGDRAHVRERVPQPCVFSARHSDDPTAESRSRQSAPARPPRGAPGSRPHALDLG